jgi:hypothetical protein
MSRRMIVFSGLATVLLCAGAALQPAAALQPTDLSQLVGTWNVVGSSNDLVRIVITDTKGVFKVHPYGACSPTPCDWGAKGALAYSSGVGSPIGIGFSASFNQVFVTNLVTGHLIQTAAGGTELEVTVQSHFAKGDGRYDYEETEDFQLAPSAD